VGRRKLIAVKKERYDIVLELCPRTFAATTPSLGKGKMIAEEDGFFEYLRRNVVLNSGVGPCGTLALNRRNAASKIATA
jgi:hypothetical protein